jgi:ABC-2 type transport system permease protein
MTTVAVEHEATRAARPALARIPFSRLASVELRKTFDTRAGFWLMASIAITALIATAATVAFAPDDELTYEAFATAIGFPMSVLLPVIAVLSVTSEWSQRSGLTTFTLVPHRSRTVLAKGVVAIGIAVASMLLALAIGAVGNVVGTAIAGLETSWNVTTVEFCYIVLANTLGLLVGFMLGVLIRNSAAAIVGYFVYSFVLPTLSELLASSQDWFKDLQPWADFNYAQSALFNGSMSGEQWANLGVTSLFWLALPLAMGLRLIMRSEVK